jgi:hypothetical protein
LLRPGRTVATDNEEDDMLMALLRALVSALKWIAGTTMRILLLPISWLAPSGRAAIPHAPTRGIASGPDEGFVRSAPPPSMPKSAIEQRHAAAVIGWLAARLRQGSGAGELSTNLPRDVRTWAYGLNHDQKLAAIHAGFPALSAHLAGRHQIPGLPLLRTAIEKRSDDMTTSRQLASRGRRQGFDRTEDDYSPAPSIRT